MKLFQLNPGETFIIPFLKDCIRNCVKIRDSETASTVEFQRLQDDMWIDRREQFSNSVEVVVTGQIELKENSDGILGRAESFSSIAENAVGFGVDYHETHTSDKIKQVGGQKGRPAKDKITIIFPDSEFSCKDLADFNKSDYITASLSLKIALQNKNITFLREEMRNPTGKGKKTKIYQVV